MRLLLFLRRNPSLSSFCLHFFRRNLLPLSFRSRSFFPSIAAVFTRWHFVKTRRRRIFTRHRVVKTRRRFVKHNSHPPFLPPIVAIFIFCFWACFSSLNSLKSPYPHFFLHFLFVFLGYRFFFLHSRLRRGDNPVLLLWVARKEIWRVSPIKYEHENTKCYE